LLAQPCSTPKLRLRKSRYLDLYRHLGNQQTGKRLGAGGAFNHEKNHIITKKNSESNFHPFRITQMLCDGIFTYPSLPNTC